MMGKYPAGMQSQRPKGFTLIELMIVIAIVAILVALAVPAYQAYTIRAKVTECIATGAPIKTSLSEFYQSMARWPANIREAGIPEGQINNISEFCSYYLYNDGLGDYGIEVDVSLISAGMGRIFIIMSPTVELSGFISCECAHSPVSSASSMKYLPSSCRDYHQN